MWVSEITFRASVATLLVGVLAASSLGQSTRPARTNGMPNGARPVTSRPAGIDGSLGRSKGSAPTTQTAAVDVNRSRARPYTGPGITARGVSLGSLSAVALANVPTVAAGRERSEASITPVTGTLSTPSALQAAPSVVGVSTNSRRGLLNGPTTGLQFAASNTLLTARVNPATGPNGRCQTLINAGFGANLPALCGVRR